MLPNRSYGPHNSQPTSNDPLKDLTMVPKEALCRAIAHGQDSTNSAFYTVEDSRIAIAWAVREAMESQGMKVYPLHELTDLPCEFIDAVLAGTADISDSEPISKLEFALRTSLNHL